MGYFQENLLGLFQHQILTTSIPFGTNSFFSQLCLSGLVTFSDGSNGFPRNEGYFQDCRFMKRMNCGDTIQKAQKVAMTARALCDED